MEVSDMPPINRDNLRDAVIAIAVATGLVLFVAAFKGYAANSPPAFPRMIAQLVSWAP